MTREPAIELLGRNALFADLDDDELRELAGLLRPFSLATDEVLFRQGTPADRMYLVTSQAGGPSQR